MKNKSTSMLENRIKRLEKYIKEDSFDLKESTNVVDHINDICDQHNLWEDVVYTVLPFINEEDLYDVCYQLSRNDRRFKELLNDFEE